MTGTCIIFLCKPSLASSVPCHPGSGPMLKATQRDMTVNNVNVVMPLLHMIAEQYITGNTCLLKCESVSSCTHYVLDGTQRGGENRRG